MNDEIWRNISRIAGLLEKQAWADGIKEIPQSEIHYRKNKNRAHPARREAVSEKQGEFKAGECERTVVAGDAKTPRTWHLF